VSAEQPDTEPETVIVTMGWSEVGDPLLAELVRYVVMTRGEPGCRNVDLCASVTTPARVVIVEKWATFAAQRAHFDGTALLTLARAAETMGAARPEIELLQGLSAHDLV